MTPYITLFVAGADYDGKTIDGVVEDGTTVTEIKLMILDDDIEEVDEETFSFSLSLSNPPPGVVLGGSEQGTVTITDDDSESVCICDFIVDLKYFS